MFFIDTSRNGQPVYDPIINQSLDNYLLNDLALEGRGLILYINAPSVIIGRHQNAYAEVDLDYLKENDITLVRRTGGGGAVYHDYGNLIFENIHIGDTTHYGDFKYYAQPILDALNRMGIEAEMSGRNDITVDGKKFSGMSIVQTENAIAAGGTLMFDLDTSQASKVLTPNQDKLATKGVKSVDARVTNLKPLLPEPYQSMNSQEFKEELLKNIFQVDRLEDIEGYTLTDDDWAIIDQRVADHYGRDEWNYGKNPGFDHYKSAYFPGVGTVAFNYSVKDGTITAFQTYGDMSFGDPRKIDQALIGVDFNRTDLKKAFQKANYQDVYGDLELDKLLDLITS